MKGKRETRPGPDHPGMGEVISQGFQGLLGPVLLIAPELR